MISFVIDLDTGEIQITLEVVEDLEPGLIVHVDIRVASYKDRIIRIQIKHFLQKYSELCDLRDEFVLLARCW